MLKEVLIVAIFLVGSMIMIILGGIISDSENKEINSNSCEFEIAASNNSQQYTSIQPSRFFISSPMYIFNYTDVRISYPNATLYPYKVASTGSMRPTINDGGIVIVDLHPSNFSVGDIIGYNCSNRSDITILHRIINISNGQFICKGDNNKIDDLEGFGCTANFSNINFKVVGVLY